MRNVLEKEKIKELRILLNDKLKEYNGDEHIYLDIKKDVFNAILFGQTMNGRQLTSNIKSADIIKKLDLTDADFYDICITGWDFSESKGVKINPQSIKNKDLYKTRLKNVEIIGSFDGCRITNADFTGSKGALINPETILDRDLRGVNFADAKICGSFDDCFIVGASFKGSKGALINPQTIRNKDLCAVNFADTEIMGSFDYCKISGASFIGSKGVRINPRMIQDVIDAKLYNIDYTLCYEGAEIIKDEVDEFVSTIDSIESGFQKVMKKM